MNHKGLTIFALLSITLLGMNNPGDHSNVPETLKGTTWTSQFYHYCNFYQFETDSTGFSQDGQVAWSCPVDTVALGISEDQILYSDPEKFKYEIKDTVLTIAYDGVHKKVFYYRANYKDWISEYEFVYGKECLRRGDRKELFKY